MALGREWLPGPSHPLPASSALWRGGPDPDLQAAGRRLLPEGAGAGAGPAGAGQSLWRRPKPRAGSTGPPLSRFPSPVGFALKRPKNEGNGHWSRTEGRRKTPEKMEITFLASPGVSYPRLKTFRVSSAPAGGPAVLVLSARCLVQLLAPCSSKPLPALPRRPGASCPRPLEVRPWWLLGDSLPHTLCPGSWREAFPVYWCSLKWSCLRWGTD